MEKKCVRKLRKIGEEKLGKSTKKLPKEEHVEKLKEEKVENRQKLKR